LFAEDARALSDRRDRVSSIFLSILSLMLGAQGYLLVTNRDSDIRSTALIWIIALFGSWLCQTWRRAILSFKELLNFRYYALKHWEGELFPDDERYYVAEEVLYHVHEAGATPASGLAAEYVKERRKLIPFFSDTYSRLPIAALLALWGIALIRSFFLLAPHLLGSLHVGG
jgi:hypothetical protein